VFGVIIATMGLLFASQALISGTFTLVNEAMKLKLWPSTLSSLPSQIKGQILHSGYQLDIVGRKQCGVVLLFKESSQMKGPMPGDHPEYAHRPLRFSVHYFGTAKHRELRTGYRSVLHR